MWLFSSIVAQEGETSNTNQHLQLSYVRYITLPEDYKMKNSTVSIVTRPMAGRLRSLFRFPAQSVGLPLLQTVQAELEVNSLNYAMWLVKHYPRE
jgi:hypothetical protein